MFLPGKGSLAVDDTIGIVGSAVACISFFVADVPFIFLGFDLLRVFLSFDVFFFFDFFLSST